MDTQRYTNGWFERHVVEALQRVEDKIERIEGDVVELKVAKAVTAERLRLRSSVYGALGGLLPALAALIYYLIRGA